MADARHSTPHMELLLVESANFVVGMDARVVLRVDRPAQLDAINGEGVSNDQETIPLAHLLGYPVSTVGTKQRILHLAPNGTRRLAVDRVLEAQSATVANLRSTPPFLHHVGMPRWILGFMSLGNGPLVVLLEPTEAFEHRCAEA